MSYEGFTRSLLSTIKNFNLFRDKSSFKGIGKLDLPCSVIWGTSDETVPFEGHKEMQKDVENLFIQNDKLLGPPNLVIYNPSARVRGGIAEVDPVETQKAINITCFGAFLCAQQAATRMLKRGSGSIFFTGASAGVKGYPKSSVFAMGKFGLRGLAQALARELHPQNIHIGHFVIDGGIHADHRPERKDPGDDSMLDPDAIAETYLQFHRQDRSSWAWEIELRPWVETF